MKDTVTVITHRGEPVAAILDHREALVEFRYLTFHGDGYEMKTLPLEATAGGYAHEYVPQEEQ